MKVVVLGILFGLVAGLLIGNVRAESGRASFYGQESGTTTASGERFRHNALTAAHPALPFGTVVTVTNLRNGRSVVVRINDRGPAKWTHRIIDVSLGAAKVLGMIEAGVVPVDVR